MKTSRAVGFLAASVIVFLTAGSAARAQSASPATAQEALRLLQESWRTRNAAAYMALWALPSDATRAEELAYVRAQFEGDETELRVDPPARASGNTLRVGTEIFSVKEPRARLDQWLMTLEHRPEGWRFVAKEVAGQIDGLIHLSLDPAGFRAAGLTLRLEDFELKMTSGTLFLSPPELGPTLLVFIGDGTVHLKPRPPEEQEQLRQFAGRTELAEKVTQALVRIHPADFRDVLVPARLEPDPAAARRLPAAQRLFREQGARAFVLDAGVARAPWWLLPGLGDSATTFATARRGVLTFTVSAGESEGISLFDRDKRRQICLYPSRGSSAIYSEDQGRMTDILHHDLRVRVDPAREAIAGEDTLRIEVLGGIGTVKLRLDDALRVESVTSAEVGSHFFFRVRNQDTLMISLGSLAGTLGEISLTVKYSGTLNPGPIESEVLQTRDPQTGRASGLGEEDVPIEAVMLYTNRNAWYPQGVTDDYATATMRFDVPLGQTAITGGVRKEARVAGDRVLLEFEQSRPGRYITAAIGRFYEGGSERAGTLTLRGYAVPRQRGEIAGVLKQAAEILAFYERLFGPCPYETLNLALLEGYAPGGHSPPGMILLQRRPVLLRSVLRDDPANFSDVPGFFLAHELAHQWWGHGVAGQNYRERWISEGLAQYAAALWVQKARGEDTFQGMLKQFSRWALRDTDKGPVHLGYRLGHVKGDPQIFRAIAYDKAAYVLHMLRGVVGDDAFFAALRTLQSERRFQKVGSSDVREAIEKASGRDLQAYFAEWIFGTRIPSLSVTQVNGADGLTVAVTPTDLPGPVPLTIAIESASARRLEKVTLEPAGGRWKFSAGGDARAEVNADRGLLATVVKP